MADECSAIGAFARSVADFRVDGGSKEDALSIAVYVPGIPETSKRLVSSVITAVCSENRVAAP